MYKTKIFYLPSMGNGYPEPLEKDKLNKLISDGWHINSMIPQVVSAGYGTSTEYGGFMFILNK